MTWVDSSSLRSTSSLRNSSASCSTRCRSSRSFRECRQPPRLRANDLEVALRLLGGDFSVEHERREAEHAGERCPQLVRDVAHQLALDLLAFAKRAVSLFEIRDGALE